VYRAVAAIPYVTREVLLNEAKIYDTFLCNLQDGEAPIEYCALSTEALDWDNNMGDLNGEEWNFSLSHRRTFHNIAPMERVSSYRAILDRRLQAQTGFWR
jgi:hypothetical protein